MTRIGACLLALLASTAARAQDPVAGGYHRAPPSIQAILEAPATPGVAVSPDHKTLAILGRESLPTIANVSKPILRLGGYRIDPATNGPAEVRVQWLNALSLQDLDSGRTTAVKLPAGARFASLDWSPDGQRVGFVMQEPAGLALWVAERDGTARKIASGVNAAFSPGLA